MTLPSGPNVALLTTIPKSGTYYATYFLYFLHHLVQNIPLSQIFTPLPDSFHKHGVQSEMKNSLGFDNFYVCHSYCPGYDQFLGNYKEAWEKLTLWESGYNHGWEQIEANLPLFDPTLNPEVKIVNIVRNPLDQAVSAWRHAQNHIKESNKYYVAPNGEQIELSDPKRFLHLVGIDAFLKLFVTFRCVQQHCPKNVLLISYEKLITNPLENFLKVLIFFGYDPITHNTVHLVQEALEYCSVPFMKKIEEMSGKTLAEDQTDEKESHIRDGGVGSWLEHFDQNDLDLVEARLKVFGLSLANFYTTTTQLEKIG